MDAIKRRQKQRFEVLHKIYDKAGHDKAGYDKVEIDQWKVVELSEIAAEMDLDQRSTLLIAEYLEQEGLIKWRGGNKFTLEHRGIVEIEEALSEPDKPTEHFPPVNIINIGGNMVSSQIQQASPDSIQTLTISETECEKLGEMIRSVKDSIDDLKLKPQQESELQAEIQTMKAQMSSPKPKRGIILESANTIRTILESATGSLIASQLLAQKVIPFIEQLI